ncbi:salicylate hydroxylase, partial [Salmonella enterica subsp. enterica serovar Anatum]|nr:salicylate hydroxylase [Salmonella enterica subsp. enterica serovar Anatum]
MGNRAYHSGGRRRASGGAIYGPGRLYGAGRRRHARQS